MKKEQKSAEKLSAKKDKAAEKVESIKTKMSQIDFSDWPFDGPRTAAWLSREIGRTGMGPAARHGQWKHEN